MVHWPGFRRHVMASASPENIAVSSARRCVLPPDITREAIWHREVISPVIFLFVIQAVDTLPLASWQEGDGGMCMRLRPAQRNSIR